MGLEAAIARRSHQLNVRNREESQHAYKDPAGFMEGRYLRQDAHENVGRVVHNLIEDFRKLDQFDAWRFCWELSCLAGAGVWRI